MVTSDTESGRFVVHFELEEREVREALGLLSRSYHTMRIVYAVALMLMGGLLGVAGLNVSRTSVFEVFGLAMAAIGLVVMALQIYRLMHLRSHTFNHMRRRALLDDLFIEQTLTFDESGIRAVSESSSESYRWRLIQRIVDEGELIMLYFSDIKGIILPKRAIAAAGYDVDEATAQITRWVADDPFDVLHCPECGYDMRKTRKQCPECGWTKGGS